ncbi:MAG: threonine aldolase family protein [Muribaculaceae bacterium]
MIQFQCDYNEGAHPAIMQRLAATNMEQTVGYGEDHYCHQAAQAIKDAINCQDADVHFLVGGTQTNTTVIASLLRPYQGVICAQSGHINVHETGAIEHTGHKVLSLPATNGKITATQVEQCINDHFNEDGPEHMVQPGMVYISFPTEIGTIYTHRELDELHNVCRSHSLPLFIDGARLGYGLAAQDADVDISQLAQLCDVFYIGGTKVGALFGEAVVFTNQQYHVEHFRYHIKQQGGMLAKGRLLGLQFLELFSNNLYLNISHHAVQQAMRIKQAFEAKGIAMLVNSTTNQQFPILTQSQIKALEQDFLFSLWQPIDKEHTAVRFCTSWATMPQNVDCLIKAIEQL